MNLNDLFSKQNIDPQRVIVLRHRPEEPELRKVLPWLAAERPDFFNAYQQTQRKKLEAVMARLSGVGYVASFIGHKPGKALFVSLYSIGATNPLTYQEYWQIPAYGAMKSYGMKGWQESDADRSSVLWFDLAVCENFYPEWKGRLVIDWPPPERAWFRRAHKNEFSIISILEDSELVARMPGWDQIQLTWPELGALPTTWRSSLSEWRGIYYIFDSSDGKGYVGSAYGESNLLGRWLFYSSKGHGGNSLLKARDPNNFVFTILERVSPDLAADDVIRLENSWKLRLHTRNPYGLNDN
jgi:hypothetical protein